MLISRAILSENENVNLARGALETVSIKVVLPTSILQRCASPTRQFIKSLEK
jgi:hypothetical protein